jgi:NADPH-dependent 2,4-dienoyl-CoA reductase/sulfur reductase-like enzyme/rhodanese-related sulfurtransferase
MKLLVIGGVAGGATAAARARRLSETAEITIVERGPYVSYANCGLPYFVEIDRQGARVRVKGPDGEAWLSYDSLILAQGGTPLVPPVPGADAPNVFRLWTVPDMDRINAWIDENKPGTAVVAGGGFIGLEMAEAFSRRGISTTVVELLPRVMSVMDPEFGSLIARRLEARGVHVRTGVGVKSIDHCTGTVELTDGSTIPGALVFFSVGVRPELTLARNAGLEIGRAGGLVVDEHLRTSDPKIWAAGDMIEVTHKVGARKVRVPLAGPANRQGRIAATNALGGSMSYTGALGTSVVKIFDATAASTGLTEHAAREAGFEAAGAVVVKDHHAGYYPGARELVLKLVYDRKTSRVLGAQAFGEEGVEKRADVVAMALQAGARLADLAEVDLAYAPPYSSANDPLNVAAFVGLNDISGHSPIISAAEVRRLLYDGDPEHRPLILDVRNLNEFESAHVRGALNIPVDELRWRLEEVPRDRAIIVQCRSGFRSHLALRVLKQNDRPDVRNLTGGFIAVMADGGFDIEQS